LILDRYKTDPKVKKTAATITFKVRRECDEQTLQQSKVIEKWIIN